MPERPDERPPPPDDAGVVPGLASLLRQATASDHEAVDASVDLRRTLADAAGYGDFLLRMARAVVPLERQIARAVDNGAAAGRRPPPVTFAAGRASWLERDWAVLATDHGLPGDGLARAVASGAELVGDDITRDDPARLAGAIYVLEGSALGSLVIARLVTQALGFDRGRGARYLAGHDVETRRRFTAILAWLEDIVGPDAAARERTVVAARETFRAFRRSFEAPLPPSAGHVSP